MYLFIFLGSSSSASSAALTMLVFLSIAVNQSDRGPTELGGDIPGLFPSPVSFPLPSFFLLPLTILFVILFVVYHAFLCFLCLQFAPGFVCVRQATFTALGCGWGQCGCLLRRGRLCAGFGWHCVGMGWGFGSGGEVVVVVGMRKQADMAMTMPYSRFGWGWAASHRQGISFPNIVLVYMPLWCSWLEHSSLLIRPGVQFCISAFFFFNSQYNKNITSHVIDIIIALYYYLLGVISHSMWNDMKSTWNIPSKFHVEIPYGMMDSK